jgi:hypothetical protein
MLFLILALVGLYVVFRIYRFISMTFGFGTGRPEATQHLNIRDPQSCIVSAPRYPTLYCETCFTNKDIDSSGWCHRCGRTFHVTLMLTFYTDYVTNTTPALGYG